MDKKIPLPNEDGGTQRHKTKINRLDTELTPQPTYFFLKCQYAKIQSICRNGKYVPMEKCIQTSFFFKDY